MIRVGVGGWTFAPWRGTFFPKGLPHAQELAYASRHLTSIEINGTFYRTQTPASFAKWAEETPEGFVFSLKGHRSVTNRARLAEAGPGIEHFLSSGVTELGPKLGPLLWQFPPYKRFDETDVTGFLDLLPRSRDGLALRHVLEVRHNSFRDPAFVGLLRRYETAVVYADSDDYPAIADVTAPFVYARLQRSVEDEPIGYAPEDLDLWAGRIRQWSSGAEPADLPRVSPEPAQALPSRDCFIYVISGAKVRAPLAAMGLIERVST